MGVEEPVQSDHCEGKQLGGTAERKKSMPKNGWPSNKIIAGGDAECRIRRRFGVLKVRNFAGTSDSIFRLPGRCLIR